MNALSYLRVSGQGQVEKDGFPRQRSVINRHARKNVIQVLEEFRDEGVSGTNEMEDREGLTALWDRLQHNGIDVVLVENASRLARDLMVSEIILRKFRELGTPVIAADSGQDLTVADGDPTRTLIRQVLGAVSQFEKSTLVAKLRASRDRTRREQGRCEGPKPFGHFDREKKALERIKALCRKPRGRKRPTYAKMAETLNEEGHSTRTGVEWSRGSVHSICQRHGFR